MKVDASEAAELMMEQIDEHEAASSRVPRGTSIQYYREIAGMCRDRANTIESEMNDENG